MCCWDSSRLYILIFTSCRPSYLCVITCGALLVYCRAPDSLVVNAMDGIEALELRGLHYITDL
jgi:hypothetical protein